MRSHTRWTLQHCKNTKKHSSKHLSVHQWTRSAIGDSRPSTSSIGFIFSTLLPPLCAVLLLWVHPPHHQSLSIEVTSGMCTNRMSQNPLVKLVHHHAPYHNGHDLDVIPCYTPVPDVTKYYDSCGCIIVFFVANIPSNIPCYDISWSCRLNLIWMR